MAESDVGTAYCVPIDISGQEIENVAIATTLGDAADPVANGMIRLVLNFTAFTIMLIAIVFGAPYIHDIAVYQFIANPVIDAAAAAAGGAVNYVTIKNRINTFHTVYFILFCIIALFFIINSFAAGVASQMIIGIFMLLFIIIFSGRIYLHIESIISGPAPGPGAVDHKHSTYTVNIPQGTSPDPNFNNMNRFNGFIISFCGFILVFGLIIFLVPGYTSEVKWPYFMLCIPVFIYLSYIVGKYLNF